MSLNSIVNKKTYRIKEKSCFFANTNIALAKYWGKRNQELNLPQNSSLSVTLPGLGTETTLSVSEKDSFVLNGNEQSVDSEFSIRLKKYLDFFRSESVPGFSLVSNNNIPTAAGLASSASGYAALVMCLNDLLGLELRDKEKSILARIGSGSACRSFWNGFVKWQKGDREDGMDSYAYPLDLEWEGLRMGIIEISDGKKEISSRKGMNHTVQTSPLYIGWPEQTEKDLGEIKLAIEKKDFSRFGELIEANALSMHATMQAARPGFSYFLPETLKKINLIKELRSSGFDIYFTADAGANLKCFLFRRKSK